MCSSTEMKTMDLWRLALLTGRFTQEYKRRRGWVQTIKMLWAALKK